MAQFFYTAQEACTAAMILIPVFLLLNHFRIHSIKTSLLYLVFSVYLAGVYAVVGLPNVAYIRFEPNFNFIPFAGMLSSLSDTLLNVVLFVPFGLFLFLFWKDMQYILTVVSFAFCTSLAIEFLQIFTFRASDVNDLITNTAGALVGYCLGFLIAKAFPNLPLRCRLSDLPLVMGISTAVMFFFQPMIWNII